MINIVGCQNSGQGFPAYFGTVMESNIRITFSFRQRPGELDYADLEDLRVGLVPRPSGATAAAAVVRPPAYEGTDYADITQFGVPQPDPTYANVSKEDVTYSNMQSM